MIRRFAKNINNRKDLVNKISSITGIASHYTGMPRSAYEIGSFTVERDGVLLVSVNEEEGGNEGAVILALRADNMIGEEIFSQTSQTPHIIEEEQSGEQSGAQSGAHTEEEHSEEPAEESTVEESKSDKEADVATSYIPVEEMDDASYIMLGIEDWDPTEQEDEKTDEQPTEVPQLDDELQIEEPQFVEIEETVTQDTGGSEAPDSEWADYEDDDSEESRAADSDCGSLEVAFPLYKHTPTSIINLVCMLHSRGPLLSKATGGKFSASKELTDALLDSGIFVRVKDVVKFIDDFATPSLATTDATSAGTVNTETVPDEITPDDVERRDLIGLRFENDRLILDGFTNVPDEAHTRTFTHLASAMNKMALKQKRVQAKKVDETNEKYSLRIWLTRLNLNGDEYKEDRKILMENLTGHTAFRTEAEKEKWTKRQLAKKMALKATKERDETANEPAK